jgi:hypothetical protein
MSTPERSHDPGEHGYGGTKQDFPTEDESDDKEHRLDDDERTNEEAPSEQEQGGWPWGE